MERGLIRLGCYSMAAAIGLGAFGAHALKRYVSDPYLLDVWGKGVLYHVITSIGILCSGIAPSPSPLAANFLLAGETIFSGSLYLLVLTDKRWLGAITPVGGLSMIAGWITLGMAQ